MASTIRSNEIPRSAFSASFFSGFQRNLLTWRVYYVVCLLSSPACAPSSRPTHTLSGRARASRAAGPLQRGRRRPTGRHRASAASGSPSGCSTPWTWCSHWHGTFRGSPVGERAEFRSFNELICPQEQRRRDRQAEHPRRLHVDRELKLGRLLDGQVGGLGAAEDLIHVGGGAAEQVRQARGIRHQATRGPETPKG